MSTEADLVTLIGGGPAVPLAAVRFLLDLEGRGFVIRRDGEGLAVAPARWLTDQDRRTIQRHRGALLALVDHCARVQ